VTRPEALKVAAEHVAALGTNTRGYNDVAFRERVDAVERLARFLMEGENDGA
jgi:hypothetical protein